jgi:uncharacterized protein YkwD
MLRQTAFGIALSTLVLAAGFMTVPIPGKSFTQQDNQTHQSFNAAKQTATNLTFQSRLLEKSVFEQINAYRINHHLPRLSLNVNITRQARIHSQDMADGNIPFSHRGFEKRVIATSLLFSSAAENVAFNTGYSDPAQQAVIGWLHSPGHLKNILGNYNLTGIGVATNDKGDVYLTQIFLNNNKQLKRR